MHSFILLISDMAQQQQSQVWEKRRCPHAVGDSVVSQADVIDQ